MRSGRKTTGVLAGLLVGLFSTVVIGGWQRSRPNVVMIVVDSLRADALSDAAGSAETPNFCALQAEAICFPHAFSHSPVALPAHVGLESGRLPHETAVLANDDAIDPAVGLLPEWLQANGYQTMAVLSLEELRPVSLGAGLDRGFHLFDGGTEPVERADSVVQRVSTLLDRIDPNQSFYLLAHFADPHEPYDGFEGSGHQAHILLDDRPVGWVTTSELNRWDHEVDLSPGEHLLEFSSDAGIRLRNFTYEFQGRAMPFEVRVGDFLGSSERIVIVLSNPSDAAINVSLRAWLNDTPPLVELRARYRSEVERVDQALGDLVEDLKRRGLYEDTVIVVTGGHGEALGDHGHVGHDVNLFDEMLHVPLFIRVPRDMSEQRARLLESSLGIARHIDLAPTLLELVDLPAWGPVTGESLLHESNRTALAVTAPPAAPRTLFSLRDHQYKLIYAVEGAGRFELYRLGSDPLELDNVFAHQGHLRRDWQMALRNAAASLVAPR